MCCVSALGSLSDALVVVREGGRRLEQLRIQAQADVDHFKHHQIRISKLLDKKCKPRA